MKQSTEDLMIKNDYGKVQLTLVPRQIIFDVARVREFGVMKYADPENWKKVSTKRYKDAAFRHFMAYLDDPQSIDEESGLTHLAHLACNIAFLCALEKEEREKPVEVKYSNESSSMGHYIFKENPKD